MLPPLKTVQKQEQIFLTEWQTVIFRNYGFVALERIAKTLGCSEECVEQEAARLGLPVADRARVDRFEKCGYITIIRNNWFLLPYEQLEGLLGIDEERLAFWLEKEDFLGVKLGDFKPDVPPVSYTPLTEEEKQKTKFIADMVDLFYQNGMGVMPFDFLNALPDTVQKPRPNRHTRIVHGYLTPCGDVFMEDDEKYMPDTLLSAYAAQGVTAVWVHGLLSALSPYPFDERLSKDYVARRARLQKLITRCKNYGIKVYLYLNEPRDLPLDGFGKYAHLAGRTENGRATLCLEQAEMQAYLYQAVKDLLQAVPDLGGFITITMSENPTHCNYRPHTNCPVCKHIPPEKSAAKVNNIIAKAVRDSGSGAEVIANLWGWSPFMEWTEEQTLRGIDLLDKDISVMSVSEYDLPIEKGGVQSKVIDYSIGNVGPSEITIKSLSHAKAQGHKTYAKIQVNNSWECSCVPYLPVFDLTYRHIENLKKIGVEDFMLTWTLGGYPSPTLGMIAAETEDNLSLNGWYRQVFGDEAERVHGAVQSFCQGLQAYPFSLDSLYFSPKTLGAANLWSLNKNDCPSTMVCYAFDDYETWTKPYGAETYLAQYRLLLSAWRKGLETLKTCQPSHAVLEMQAFAGAAYAHFTGDALQTEFSVLKADVRKNKARLQEILAEEEENATSLLGLVRKNVAIGFETSNHYFYTERNLVEKVLCVRKLQNELNKICD